MKLIQTVSLMTMVASAFDASYYNTQNWIMRKFDTNADGSIDKEEYAKVKGKKQLNYVFQVVDRDGDGLMSKKEVDQYLTKGGLTMWQQDTDILI